MKRAERLLDLAAYLLRATKPVSWGAIRDHFSEDYGCSEEAAIRKFERDKSELVELGVPVRWVKGEEELETGYLIDRDEFYLPNLELEPEDLVLLYMAGSAALAQGVFPYARDLSHALNKLSFAARAAGASEAAALAAESLSRGAEGEMAWPGANGTTSRKFEKLSAAVAAKKRIHLKYCGAERGVVTDRDVDPYGVYQSGGAWFLVGYCHLRKALRTFHLGRVVELAVNPAVPRSSDFALPPGFELREYATKEPWEYVVHPPLQCTVRLEGPVEPEARASFGPRAQVREDSGGALVEVTATNGEALVRHVLALERAEILAPQELRSRARGILASLAEACA